MDFELAHGTSAPEEKKMYVVFVCKDGHTTPVYPVAEGTNHIVHRGRCCFAVPHIAKERLDLGFAEVDKPVAVWFAGGNGKLPWMSMLRACDKPFVGYEVVPAASPDLKVEFPESDDPMTGLSNAQGADDKGDIVL